MARRFLEPGGRPGPGLFGELYTDDTTYECGPFGLAFTGRDPFVRHLREYAGAVPGRKFTIKRIIADGDTIAVEFGFAGTSAGVHSGLPPAGEPVTAPLLLGSSAARGPDRLADRLPRRTMISTK